jgi:hypothetical protein
MCKGAHSLILHLAGNCGLRIKDIIDMEWDNLAIICKAHHRHGVGQFGNNMQSTSSWTATQHQEEFDVVASVCTHHEATLKSLSSYFKYISSPLGLEMLCWRPQQQASRCACRSVPSWVHLPANLFTGCRCRRVRTTSKSLPLMATQSLTSWPMYAHIMRPL